MKVYIVTSGFDSDYHIDAVFEKREEAEKYVAVENTKHSYDDYYVETYETSDGTVQVEKYYKAIDIIYYEKEDLKMETILTTESYPRFYFRFSLKPIEFEIKRYGKYKFGIIYPFEGDFEKQFDRIKKDIQDKIAEFKAKEAGIAL